MGDKKQSLNDSLQSAAKESTQTKRWWIFLQDVGRRVFRELEQALYWLVAAIAVAIALELLVPRLYPSFPQMSNTEIALLSFSIAFLKLPSIYKKLKRNHSPQLVKFSVAFSEGFLLAFKLFGGALAQSAKALRKLGKWWPRTRDGPIITNNGQRTEAADNQKVPAAVKAPREPTTQGERQID